MDHIHTTMTPWPSYWAYIIAIPHIHNFYPTTQLLDLYDTYVTYIKHWLPGTFFWAHIIHIPHTHTFPPGPVTGLSSYMDHIHTTMTPWPSYWAHIIAIPHMHNFYPTAQLLDLYDTYVTYIKHWLPGTFFWAHMIHIPHTHTFPPGPVTGLSSYMDHIHTTMTPWPSYWAHIIAIPHMHNFYPMAQFLDLYDTYVTYIKHWLPGTLFLGSHHTYTIYTHLSPWPSNWAFIIHGPHTHNYDSLAQLLGLHHSNTTYSQLLSHSPVTGLIWHIYHLHKTLTPGHHFLGSRHTYTIYAHIPPVPVTEHSSYMDHIHTTMTPWPSSWAHIIAIPHMHNFYPTAQLLDLYDTYVTYIKHWLPGTFFWAHIIHIPHTHTFPPGPVTGLSSYMDHIHTAMTPWPSYWAHIIAIPHMHNFYPMAQFLDLYDTYVTYIKHWLPGTLFLGSHHTYTIYTHLSPWPSNWAFIIHGPHTHNYDSLAQLLGLHHSNTTYSQLLSHSPVTGLIWHIYHLHKTLTPGHHFLGSRHTYTIYAHIPPVPVTGHSSYMGLVHTTMTPWPSYGANIVAIPHFHNCYPTAQLLDLYDTYVTYIKHGLLGTIFWAHIIHIPYTHTFPPSPVTGLSSYMDHIHNYNSLAQLLGLHHTCTPPTPPPNPQPPIPHPNPRPSYWVNIVHITHTHSVCPVALVTGFPSYIYLIYTTYTPGNNFWAHTIHIPYTYILPPH